MHVLDIRAIRQQKNMRQRDFAQLLGVSVAELSKIERYLQEPSPSLLKKLSAYLNEEGEALISYSAIDHLVIGEGYVTAIPQQSFYLPRRQPIDVQKIPVLDLFCGVGGFSYGFEQTGKFTVVGGLDLLPDRVNTFAENHRCADVYCADIQTFDFNQFVHNMPKPQVIIGSPPCQGFSSIRPFRTLTQQDKRNNLFEHFALALDFFKPDWFVLENVVGLLTHQRGQTFKMMLALFEQIGYTTVWQVLNAASYGLPQRRERLIVVGNLQGQTFMFPTPTHQLPIDVRKSMAGKKYVAQSLPLFDTPLQPSVCVIDAIHDLPPIQAGEQADEYDNRVELTEYEALMRGKETRLTLHHATAHTPKMLEIIRYAGHNRAQLPHGLTTSGFSTSYSRLDPHLPSVTLTVNFVHPSSNKCIHPYQNRALTPREGARLQGFPDNYIFRGTRSQIVKQIGNAVPPILGKVIAYAIYRHLHTQ